MSSYKATKYNKVFLLVSANSVHAHINDIYMYNYADVQQIMIYITGRACYLLSVMKPYFIQYWRKCWWQIPD